MLSEKKIPWNKGIKKQAIISCRFCGTKFNKLYRKDQVFCSRKCSHKDPVKNKKISKAIMGHSGYWKGKKRIRSKTECQKISNALLKKWADPAYRKKMSGSNSKSGWKGGKTKINKLVRSSATYKKWRDLVFSRDDYRCVFCKARCGKGKKIELHSDHIKPFSLFPKLRFEVSNGRTLCASCHRKTDTYGANILKHDTR